MGWGIDTPRLPDRVGLGVALYAACGRPSPQPSQHTRTAPAAQAGQVVERTSLGPYAARFSMRLRPSVMPVWGRCFRGFWGGAARWSSSKLCWRVPELRVTHRSPGGTQLDTREYALTARRWGGAHERHERDCATRGGRPSSPG